MAASVCSKGPCRARGPLGGRSRPGCCVVAVKTEAAGDRSESGDLLRFQGSERTRSVAAPDRSTGTGRTQRATAHRAQSSRARAVAAQRVVRQLELVALAHEEAERPLASRGVSGGGGSGARAARRGASSSCSPSRRARAGSCWRSTPSSRSRRSMRSRPTRRGCGGPRRSAGRTRVVEVAALEQRREDLVDQPGSTVALERAPISASVRSRWPRKRHAMSNASWRSALGAGLGSARRS